MRLLTKTRGVGGSLVVTIPIEIVKDEMLSENEFVEVEVKKHKKDFFVSLKKISSFSKEDRLEGQLE